jgi:hypothetical protein
MQMETLQHLLQVMELHLHLLLPQLTTLLLQVVVEVVAQQMLIMVGAEEVEVQAVF